jgi:flagellar biosynthesis protein FlhG
LIAVLRGARHYDRILLDLAAGVDDAVLHLAAKADETVLVLTPDPAALTDAYAFTKLLLRRGAAKPSAVINMATSEPEARKTADALVNAARAFLSCAPEYLGGIPRDPHVQEAVRRQGMLASLYPQSHAVVALVAIARRLHRRIPAPANAVNVR